MAPQSDVVPPVAPSPSAPAVVTWGDRLARSLVWFALGLILIGATGMWTAYTAIEERVIRIARENLKFPPNSIVAFSMGPEKCPEKWREVTELRGRFIIGAGQGTDLDIRPYGQAGGLQSVTLTADNLPPHRHQVYRHAGEIIGETSGIVGAGSTDPHAESRVRESMSGLGVGPDGARLRWDPVKTIPPYFAYTFCRPE